MKNYCTYLLCLMGISSLFSQAYSGEGDQKFQVGINLQDNGTGINATYDYGLAENISLGISSTYLLSVDENLNAGFTDRFDVKARANAHLGNVIGLGDEFDIYPGLDLGLKNFGFHTGVRYFLSDGFGLFGEVGFPIARYKTEDRSPAEELHNQLVVGIGASFNFR